MAMCYLAGAIDLALPEQAREWRQKAARVLNENGVHCFNPAAAFHLSRADENVWLSHSDFVININNMALDNSEFMLAEMEFGVASTGTVTELIRAAGQDNKTVVIWNSSKFVPLYLNDLAKHPHVVILPTLLDCVDYIVEKTYGHGIAKSKYNEMLDMAKKDVPTIKIKLLDGHPLKCAKDLNKIDEIDPMLILFKKYNEDTGYDVIASKDMVIPARGKENIPTHMSIQPPKGYWYRIVGRSSTFHVRDLLVVEGIIDQPYRGHLYCSVQNLTDEIQVIKAGESIAQLVFHENTAEGWAVEVTDELEETARGANGFGSTTDAKAHIFEMYQEFLKLVEEPSNT